MTNTHRTVFLLLSAAALGACQGRDVQTEDPVTTTTSEGAVSTSISGDSADRRGQALVRVVNAVPANRGLTVRADEQRSLDPVDYKNVTPYQAIDGTWTTFQVTGTQGGAYLPLETNREMLTDGHRYSIIVMPDDDGEGFETRILRDEINNDPNRVQLRVIHAAPGVDEIDVVARGGDEIFGDVNYAREAGFKTLDPWSGTLEIRASDGNRQLFTLPNVKLEAGKSYSIVVTRDANRKFDAFWFEDVQEPQPQQQPLR